MDYVTADLHFNHKGIISFERGQFKTVEEHDNRVLRAINSALSPDDVLWVLGDVGFRTDGGLRPLGDMIRRIECRKKILIMGNHDKFSLIEAKGIGFDEAYKGPIYYPSSRAPGKIILSHYPVREAYENPYVINVHGHIHSGVIDLPNFFNVNIHMAGYRIVPLKDFEDIAVKTLKPREERYPNEWYSQFEKKVK